MDVFTGCNRLGCNSDGPSILENRSTGSDVGNRHFVTGWDELPNNRREISVGDRFTWRQRSQRYDTIVVGVEANPGFGFEFHRSRFSKGWECKKSNFSRVSITKSTI